MLRPYQQDLHRRIFSAWLAAIRCVLAVMPTGAGKTVLMAAVFETIIERGGCGIAVAHRQELVAQISLALARAGLAHTIIAPDATIRWIVELHVEELGRSFYHPKAALAVAGIDTLIRRADHPFLKDVTHWCIDEAHHVLAGNKWGSGLAMLPAGALGLGLTATPLRADRKGLGRTAAGVFDEMLVGPTMRELIDASHLADYRIYGLPKKIDMSGVTIGAGGDFNGKQLRNAAHKSMITGDIVQHAIRLAPGMRGVTFAVDIEIAEQHAQAFRDAGVRAAVLSSKTPDRERQDMIRAYKAEARTLDEIVNVDVLGEGFDCPGIVRASFARPTASYGLYVQQFGRALRPLEGKLHGIILDHVGNVERHKLPDKGKAWSLDGPPPKPAAEVPIRICVNPGCMLAFEGYSRTCPYCGETPPATGSDGRVKPEVVEGNLLEYTPAMLAALRDQAARIMGPAELPYGASPVVARAVMNKWEVRRQAQNILRDAIAWWAGHYRDRRGATDAESYIRFHRTFGMDVLEAQALSAPKAAELAERVRSDMERDGREL